MTALEKTLIETVTIQRGCLLESHFVLKTVMHLLQSPLSAASKKRIKKLLLQSIKATKKELCESKELSKMHDCEEGRIGF